jgi:hypothetical protein
MVLLLDISIVLALRTTFERKPSDHAGQPAVEMVNSSLVDR